MLDDVERRRFLVQPAREHPLPAPVGALDVQLDESAGQRLTFPRGGGLAGAQAHDDILDPHRLAGPKRQVADDSVALVQQPEHGDSLRHRGDSGLLARGLGDVGGHRPPGRLALGVPVAIAAAGAERHNDRRGNAGPHAQSGVQGW